MGAEAKNLEAIVKAIDQHDRSCEYPAVAVRMNPFEVERLGWDTIRGLPIHSDDRIGTGRFEVVCGGDDTPGLEEEETVEAVAEQELVIPLEPAAPGRG
ncbi:MAG: hypothetical protein H0U32_08215 [Thermoleophilaceae bacterium]|jgi:hypothetical protein|nr:hypothetical protein [Thermoleophilaceae bacterium]MDQ3481184.1 hypothetical protein [Actinomycetota bacterium]